MANLRLNKAYNHYTMNREAKIQEILLQPSAQKLSKVNICITTRNHFSYISRPCNGKAVLWCHKNCCYSPNLTSLLDAVQCKSVNIVTYHISTAGCFNVYRGLHSGLYSGCNSISLLYAPVL